MSLFNISNEIVTEKMMKRSMDVRFKFLTRIIISLTMLMSVVLSAQSSNSAIDNKIPHVISFQGTITSNTGNKLPDGNYNVTFKLYDQPEGGSPLWTENFTNLNIENGNLQLILGKKDVNNPITIRFDRRLYLEVSINGELETYKRIELGVTAYSLGSEYAEEVADGSITNEKIAPLAVTNQKISSFDWKKITDIDPDPYSIYWTIMGNIIYGPDRNYVGTIEEKDFVLKTFSIERMRFDPYGRVTLGTPSDTVNFVVIGKSKFQDVFIRGNLGINVMPGGSKVHVNTNDITPFKVSVDGTRKFQVSSNGKVEITSSLTGGSLSDSDENSYPLFVHSPSQGIAIKVDVNGANNDNNFVSFWNSSGMQGRIEGEDMLNYLADPLNIARDVNMVALAAADITAIALADEIEPASAISFTAGLLYNSTQIAIEEAQIGVTYESASGDYAEWLERIDPNEKINPGDIVGIFNGKISKTTTDADQLLCISFSPVVLGNQPAKGKESEFDKVAFLGQVPVKVYGKVHRGDYILPSGLNDGSGIAVNPDLMTIDDYLNILGRAWDASDIESVKYVNTAIGFDNRDLVNLLQLKMKQNQKLNEQSEIRRQNIEHAKEKVNSLFHDITNIENELDEVNRIIKTKNNSN